MSLSPDKVVTAPRLLFRPDPVIGWALSPEHAVRVPYRAGNVMQHIGADGWRRVPERPDAGKSIAVYGCSFTYGTGLEDAETYCALLQKSRPDLRVLNRGIGGHGTVQNLLQLRRDIAAGVVDAAVFAIISDHRFRNIPHPQRMRQYLAPEWFTLGVEHVPVAKMTAQGTVEIDYCPIWQPVIRDADFDVFLPDEYMITAATLAVLELVRDTARGAGVPLQFAVLDQYDPDFTAAVLGRFEGAVDISTPEDSDHTFLPRNLHPNAHANTLYAQRLEPVIAELCDHVTSDGAS